MFTAGLFMLNFSVLFGSAAGGRRIAALTINGVEARRVDVAGPSGAGPATVQVTHYANLLVGDTIQCGAFQNSGAAVNLTAPHIFQALRLG